MKKYLIIGLLFILPNYCMASGQKLYESNYNDYWCNARGGIREAETVDGSRVDCLLPEYAIEGERAYKWKEAVGQSLFYGIQTQRQPGILLIIENPKGEQKYINRLNKVGVRYGIKIWYITPAELLLHHSTSKP